MSSDDALLKTSGTPRFLRALVAGLAGVLAAALFLGVFHSGLPGPMHAEVALAAAAPSAPGLCFHGPEGDLLDFAPAGQGCRYQEHAAKRVPEQAC